MIMHNFVFVVKCEQDLREDPSNFEPFKVQVRNGADPVNSNNMYPTRRPPLIDQGSHLTWKYPLVFSKIPGYFADLEKKSPHFSLTRGTLLNFIGNKTDIFMTVHTMSHFLSILWQLHFIWNVMINGRSGWLHTLHTKIMPKLHLICFIQASPLSCYSFCI